MFRFVYPFILILIPCLALPVYLRFRSAGKRVRSMRIGHSSTLKANSSVYHYKLLLPEILFLAAAVFLILALARPQLGNVSKTAKRNGIDIMLALDISGSMQLNDFKPNRLEASKKVAEDFVNGRKQDRIGLVVFSGESFLQCPLTSDYDVVADLISKMEISPQSLDGTAIGLAVSNCINRLRDTEAKSKVIILLTDGENNAGEVDPMTAAAFAKTFGIKIYTIGMAGDGSSVGNGFFRRQIPPLNDELLRKMADATGGSFYRADSEEKLKAVWDEISQLEKSEIISREYLDWQELYMSYLLIALFLSLCAYVLKYIVWRRAVC